ncbi:viroplasmin family protein [Flavobacterium sp. LB3P45]|uniref:Ribonuclease H n=1 Tax=Flavobacterium fructosi TaxID=3230416 RepID=A0ABW6HRF5_9FLAO
MQNNKYYVVFKGYKTGIYDNWNECNKQVNGFSGTLHKSFESLDEAEKAFAEYSESTNSTSTSIPPSPYSTKSFIVNGNCPNNFGEMSYQWNLSTSTNNVKKKQLPIIGTKNIADFIAIIDLIKLSKKVKRNLPIYTNSKTVKNWILNKKCNHQLFASKKTEAVIAMIREAEEWLSNNAVENEILLWNSVAWGNFPLVSKRRKRIRKLKSN